MKLGRSRTRKPQQVSTELLRAWPLPETEDDAEKEDRGRVLVIGGSSSVPGAILLAGLAALRTGAGKLQMATSRSVAPTLAVAVPEALVVALDEDDEGAIEGGAAADLLSDRVGRADVVLVGAGMNQPGAAYDLVAALVEVPGPMLILDAAAITCLGEGAARLLEPARERIVVTPNAIEAAALASVDVEEVARDRLATAASLAERLGVVVALKGSTTYTCGPRGERFADDAGNPGLGTSGSGDVAAGAIAGIAARGCDPLRATIWGMHAHAVAGDRLAERTGPVGYLARELLDELPAVMADLAGHRGANT